MQLFSYHTHTTFSDGKNSPEEMITQAERLGLEEIGLSDHLIVHKNISKTKRYPTLKNMTFSNFQDAYERCSRHIENLRELQKNHQIKIRVGFETDFFIYNVWYENFEELIRKLDYDYLINGNHFIMDKTGENIEDISFLSQNKTDYLQEPVKNYIKRHFQTMEKAIRSQKFTFLAHFDYIKKLAEYQETDFEPETDQVIKALKETKTASELNTKGLRKSNGLYPTNSILQKLVESDIPLLVSDDAHHINELCFGFEKADQNLKNLNAKRFSLKL